MNDEELIRYSRQILLPNIGAEGQNRISKARVLIIGMGGLGAPIALYLGGAGVGKLIFVDHDKVDVSNLQRQIIYTTEDIGCFKADAAKKRVAALNPLITITAINHKLNDIELIQQVSLADVVVDASDNYETRFAINRICRKEKKPLVSGAGIRVEGKVSVFRHDQEDSPCYKCIFEGSIVGAESCVDSGVLGPTVGLIGTIQAAEVIKILVKIKEGLSGRMVFIDLLTMTWYSTKLVKNPNCPVCSGKKIVEKEKPVENNSCHI